MGKLDDCIKSLKDSSGKPDKFENLRNKYKERFELMLLIDVGNINGIEIGFDNHRNHQRPHLHTKDGTSRNTIYVDNGEFAFASKFDSKTEKKIKEWVTKRKDCLKFIYENIQKCKKAEDFDPIINAINQHIK